MTDKNTAQTATTETASTEASAPAGERQEWPYRFGGMKRLQLKQGKNGEFGIVTVDCGTFEATAFVFKEDVLAQMTAAAAKADEAGVVAQIWIKGPMEPVKNRGVEKDQMRVIYFSDNTKYEGETAEAGAAEGEVAGAGAETAEAATDQVASARMTDDEVPF